MAPILTSQRIWRGFVVLMLGLAVLTGFASRSVSIAHAATGDLVGGVISSAGLHKWSWRRHHL